MLFLIANTLSFAEVPHSYVTENPKKEVQKVETFKQREKAELNLSVTKLKTKEIEGKLVNGKLVFDITDKKDIQEGNILVTQGTPYKPNNARVRSANPTQILEATKEANRLEVTGENLQNVYVNILDNKGQLVGIYKNIKKDYLKSQMYLSGNLNYELTDEYIGGYIYDTYNMNYSSGKGYKFISGGSLESGYETMSLLPQLSNVPQGADHGSWLSTIKINKKTIFNSNLTADIGVINAVIDENLEIELKQINRYLALKLDKFPQEDFTLTIEYDGKRDFGGYSHTNDGIYWDSDYRNYHGTGYINFKFKATTLKGNSTLTFAEYYPVNEFIQFTANPTIQNAQPLALDNSVRDVTLETTGKGLVAIQQGDKLTVDGHQVVIGAGGNIGPVSYTHLTLPTIRLV